MDKYIFDMEIVLLVDVDPSLLGAYQDHELILELAGMDIEGLITCDDTMIFRAEVLEAIEQVGFSVVTCRRVGDDPVRASGLLLTHVPDVAKRHQRGRSQIWRLGAVESRPLDFAEHKRVVEQRLHR